MKKYSSICLTLILFLTSSIPLFAQFAGGSGTARDPWKVATAEQLNNVRRHLRASFVQTADINLDTKPWNQGEGWKPIGSHSSRFTGSYNGAGFVIKGLHINRPDGDAQGLFGCLQGTVQNLGLKSVNILGDSGVGALVGENLGRLQNCFSTGNVKGKYDVGGLVGNNYYGIIRNCFSMAKVEGQINAGGLIGYDEEGEISNCYSAGKVKGKQFCGGLIGESEGGIAKNSYWDMEKSGQKSSAAGEGRPTKDMVHPHSENTYRNWDWTLWSHDESHSVNHGYPYFGSSKKMSEEKP